jgi:hypothetical protein
MLALAADVRRGNPFDVIAISYRSYTLTSVSPSNINRRFHQPQPVAVADGLDRFQLAGGSLMGVSGDDTGPVLCNSVRLSFGFNCSGSLVAANGALLRVAASIPASHNAGTPALPKQLWSLAPMTAMPESSSVEKPNETERDCGGRR